LKKKSKSDPDEERGVLLAKVKSLEAEVERLKNPPPKPQRDWAEIQTVTKVVGTLVKPEIPKPVVQECSVCHRLFNLNEPGGLAQRFSPWAKLIGADGKPLKNFAKEGFFYVSCSLECSQIVSSAIDRLAVNAVKVNIGSIS
jgi:hypothetical protein